ncbi:MAG TPA: mechanosensitive ion channel family protein [Beijerinckiaceae bacterium]|nr:mechanosensitive ion channel family protein [Beijerinckiaceae bacterium]
MDRFVDSVADAVAKKLAGEGMASAQAAAVRKNAEETSETIHQLVSRLGVIASQFPGLVRHVAGLPARLDASGPKDAGFIGLLIKIAAVAGLALAAEWAARMASSGLVKRIVRSVESPPPWARWFALTAVEAGAVVAFAVVGNAVFASLFLSGGEHGRIAGLVLMGLFWWRVGLAVARCWLRPHLPAGRLAPVDDHDAAVLMRGFAMATAVPSITRAFAGILVATNAQRDEIVLYQFLFAPLVVGTFIAMVLAVRMPMARWLARLGSLNDERSWRRVLADNWHVPGVLFYVLVWAAQAYGGMSGRVDVPASLNDLQQLLIGWLLVETILFCIHRRRLDAKKSAGITAPQLEDIAWRGLNILVRIAIFLIAVRIVVTEILNLIPHSAWAGYSATLAGAGFVVFAAWAIWQVTKFYFEKVAGPARAPAIPGAENETEEDTLEGASRLQTLMPVLRSVLGVLIVGFTVLIVLSQLGVNVTPLLAGASIFGLALSFGSQSLVRDIVSGIFFLADDAFRVGEYIDIGKAKGTVESFTLRSIRLRHQGGQIHTIPFGQLGQITNFSRDWATMKFNLRFARETDIEALRKATKKIGQELLEDPDLKDDFLLPLKMQGIADIQDNALIARFKFTVKPGRPSYIQRIAVKRMLQVFPEKGIEFASATVAVKSLDQGGVLPELAAAAARGAPAPVGG